MPIRLGAIGGLAASLLLAGCWSLPTPKTDLVALEVSAPASIPAGVQRQLVATGTFDNGPARDLTGTVKWTSSDPAVAAVTDGGLVSTVGPGTATISATDPGTSIVGTATVTVTPAALVSIAVTPSASAVPLGTTARFTATGTYADGTTQDLTDTVAWSSSAPAIAAFAGGAGESGVASTGTTGTATITALHASANVSGSTTLTVTDAQLVSIAVTPATVSAPVGVPKPLTAIGTYTNGTKQDLTGSVAWSSSDPAVASVSGAGPSGGWVTGASAGTATIQAVDAATHLAGSTVLTVTPAVVVSIAVTPTAPSVPLGLSTRFTATGTYTDGSSHDLTTSVTWSSSSPDVAPVSNAGGSEGVATGALPGVTTVRAYDPAAGVAGTGTLTVTPATLASLAIGPATATVAVAGTQQLVATGTYTDGTQHDVTASVTWTSSDPTVAAVSNATGSSGLATAVAPGTVTVQGRDPGTGVAASATITVAP